MWVHSATAPHFVRLNPSPFFGILKINPYLCKMDNKERIENLIFKYLDSLFENIKITYSNHQISNEERIIAEDGDITIFTYSSHINRIYFDVNTIMSISNLFGIPEDSISDFVKSYLSKNVKSSLSSAILYLNL